MPKVKDALERGPYWVNLNGQRVVHLESYGSKWVRYRLRPTDSQCRRVARSEWDNMYIRPATSKSDKVLAEPDDLKVIISVVNRNMDDIKRHMRNTRVNFEHLEAALRRLESAVEGEIHE